ncbi:TIGR00730 family Rossman fold protein [Aquimarina hainanensis]|uniref:Cytokinin riboside 5'-monophosphate phosphoribohydrolase n=1 Tax=Aquimarina hainanensis TaxID=1578017 RepID=A0ABW5NE84_9FLAO|nr:TIGR00730 family Rossman fold protein [Aquimarina sp. TRL1]
MKKIEAVAVFCGSSTGKEEQYVTTAKQLGERIAKEGITLVYGGAEIGVMGAVANGVLSLDGEVVGVIPQFLKSKEIVHPELTRLYTTENMHQRKEKLQELSDGFIVLPGGFGTLEELFEVISWAQLKLHSKPIGLLNIDGFYNHLLKLMEDMMAKGFLRKEGYDLLLVDDTVEGLLRKMQDFNSVK